MVTVQGRWYATRQLPDGTVRSRAVHLLAGLVIGAVLTMLTACGTSSRSSAGGPTSAVSSTAAPQVAGFGQNPDAVAGKLGGCSEPKMFGSVLRCTTTGGSYVSISTFDSQRAQDFALAAIKDQSPTTCAVVLHGVVVGSAEVDGLDEFLGSAEAFAARNHGQLLCPVDG